MIKSDLSPPQRLPLRLPPPAYNTKRPLRRREKLNGICATCCGDEILLERQRFSQKFSGTHEAICRCHVLIACAASVSVWFWRKEKPRNEIFGFGQFWHGLWLSFGNHTKTLATQATCRRKRYLYKCNICLKTYVQDYSSLHGTLSLKLDSNVNLEYRGSRMLCL